VYVSALAGTVHYYWLVKSDVRKPLLYFSIVCVLLLYRVGDSVWRNRKAEQGRLV
jgi:sulfoxide reductase heme-binding subunit YedZ